MKKIIKENLKDYRIVLVIWLFCGFIWSGIEYIELKKDSLYEGRRYYGLSSYKYQYPLLITIGGGILIGGIGYIKSKK